MGASGTGPFDNDIASDWLLDLTDSAGVKPVLAAIRDLQLADAESCSVTVAACAVVAFVFGWGCDDDLPDDALLWILRHRRGLTRCRNAARQALNRLRADSELSGLWSDAGELDAWRAQLGEIDATIEQGVARPIRRQKAAARPRARLGDVLELSTNRGLAYVQFSAVHRDWGHLVRVLHGVYAERPENIGAMVAKPSDVRLFCLLPLALEWGDWVPVGRLPIPETEAGFPLFRGLRRDEASGAMRDVVIDLNQGTVTFSEHADGLPKIELVTSGYLSIMIERGVYGS